jgi:DMSO/TMAO reductase YedYZ molybdopterin-dependent catalytic subunit
MREYRVKYHRPYGTGWTGVPLRQIVEVCEPKPEARYLVFRTLQNVPESEPEPKGPGNFYRTIDFELMSHLQTILAYEMNGEPLPIEHGAPCGSGWRASSASKWSSKSAPLRSWRTTVT